MTNEIEFVQSGWSTTIQDLGRPGLAHLGIPTSGAADRATARLLNRLVGNPESAAVIETAGGLMLRADAAILIATSAEFAPTALAAGERVVIAAGGPRLWKYVAIRGGVDAVEVLGSRSNDTLSGLGPPLPYDGYRVAVGRDPGTPILADVVPPPEFTDRVRASLGARADWFAERAVAAFFSNDWSVTATSRVGVRLG